MSLDIEVANAVNLPNLEAVGKIDPYVKIEFQGFTKKTAVIKGELNPVWNEKLEFDLKGQPIRDQDVLHILVNDWELLGRNRLVGKTDLLMKDVLKTGFGLQQLHLSLFDAHQRPLGATLSLSILYKPPPGAELTVQPAGREIGASQDEGGVEDGGADGGGDGGGDQGDAAGGTAVGQKRTTRVPRKGQGPTKVRPSLSLKKQDFQLRVKIIEARQLPGSNISPICRVTCHGQTKQTNVEKSTSTPCWNEVFFFNFVVSPAELFEKMLTFGVYCSRKLRSDAFIGSFKFDVGLIYDEAQHSFMNKWLLLCDPEDTMSGHRGYLKICATLLGPGDDAPSFSQQRIGDIEDDIESNLLRPAGIILRPAMLKLKLYRAEDIPRMDSDFIQGVKKVFGSDERKELVDPYFVFGYAGREVKSKIFYNCDHPEWNQELRLAVRFPSMCEKIKLQIYDWDALTHDDIVATNCINKMHISDIQNDGFLPMFGPCYVNFYGSPREFSELPTEFEDLNFGKGEGVAYRGRALVELQTIVGEVPLTPSEDLLDEDTLKVQKFMRRRKYKLHTAFLSASMVSTIDAPIEFEVSIGNYGNKLDEYLPPCVCTTQPTNAVFDGNHYYFLPWGDTKPCVVIDSHWEDISFRLEALNLLLNIGDRLESNIAKVRLAQKGNMPLPDLAQSLISLLDGLILDCNKPLPELEESVHTQNDLDINLRQYRLSQLNYVIEEATKLRETATDVVDALSEVDSFLKVLRNLAVEPQSSVPDVIIWMISGEKRIAYYRYPAHDVLWSSNPDYRGKYCGRRDTILLQYPGNKVERENRWEIPALLRLKIWFGLAKDEGEWHKMQTEGELAVFAEAYENQSSILGKWKSAISRPEWSDVTGKVQLKKEDFQPPEGWAWEDDWYINPELSLLYDKDSGHTKFMEDVYECHSRLPGGNWGLSSNPWTDVKGDAAVARKDIELPPGWEWIDDWQVDLNRAVDEYGWEFTLEATLGGFGPVEKTYHMCRRRRWVRNRNMLKTGRVQAEQARTQMYKTEGWEYAPMFTMKFHHKERKMDLVRRRRWHRKMIRDMTEKKGVTDHQPAAPCLFNFASKLEQTTKGKKGDEEMMKAVTAAPRMFLVCKKPSRYQMRAYIYQARDLLAGDSSGLSDPFARIVFMNQSQTTEKEEKTLCPTWDQTLIFETVNIYGDPQAVLESPPEIIIEVFDHDSFGVAEFLGRAKTAPLVKLDPSDPRPVMLQWCDVTKGGQYGGELLVASELFLLMDGKELPFMPPKNPRNNKIFMVPNGIRPQMTRTAIEVMCWGVRNMKRFQLATISSPSIEFEVGGQVVQSKVIKNTSRNPNFDEPILFYDIMLPKEELYTPPLNIKVRDNRAFGRKPLIGIHVIKTLELFRTTPLPLDDGDDDEDDAGHGPNASDMRSRGGDHILEIAEDDKSPLQKKTAPMFSSAPKPSQKSPAELWEEDIDWWSKYYASTGELDKCKQYLELGYDKIKVYNHELEKEDEFKEFNDFCHTFNLSRGKNIEDEESSQVGEFKGTFVVYQLPPDLHAPLPPRILKNLPPSGPMEFIVRVYIVKAIDLQPKDPNGLADPYILVRLGKKTVNNRDEYIPNTLNPVFGRMFELKAILPLEKDLRIRVKDYDLLSADDIVGDTVIDLENRYLTRLRATVGLPKSYCTGGICCWRDSQKPTEILEKFCAAQLRSGPVYLSDNSVKVHGQTFNLSDFEQKKPVHSNLGPAKERLALHVLNALPRSMAIPLVQEHVETRPIYSPLQPGIEQGRLQMWVDMFPSSLGPPGPPVDIKSRKPKTFELRVVVWNTKDVILDETSITGERMSDIYVKGWIHGVEEKQETDVHYRSLDGEGNFNWRFVFPLDYLPAEQCVVVKKKEHFWSLDTTEHKLPPIVIFQVWDNDKFSADDFLGTLEINLETVPQPVKFSKSCNLDQLPVIHRSGGSDVKVASLFEQKRLKGFWPVYDDAGGQRRLTGKLEMEMELVSEEESKEAPVGRARSDPNLRPKLEPPKRPDTSFLWFTSPWKTCKFIVWRRFKWYFIGAVLLLLLIIFLILFFYAIPGTAVKKLFGA